MFAAWLFSYLTAFAVIGNLVLSQHPPKGAIYLLCIAFFPGLFSAIGIGMAHEESRPLKAPFFAAGIKKGMALFRSWLAFILAIAAIGGVLFLFS